MRLTNAHIESLIDEVVIPFERRILEDEAMAGYVEEEEVKRRHEIGVAKLAIKMLAASEEEARASFVRGAVAHRDLDIDRETMQFYLSVFFKLHREWTEKHFAVAMAEYDRKVALFDRFFMEAYGKEESAQEEPGEEDEGFLMFESEEVDEAIDRMHYEEDRKISAREYAEFDEIHDEEFHALVEIKERCEHINGLHERLTREFLDEFVQMARELSRVLFATMEFKDMGYALGIFADELAAIDPDALEEAKRSTIFAILLQMSDDLIRWIDAVFLDAEAIDIHYFDASFLANIAQIGILLEEQSETQEADDDDFLF